MIGPSPKSMWPNLIELVDPDKPNISLNYRLKATASDDDKLGFEKFENGQNAFFLKSIYKELKEPYYTWEGQVVERSSLENRELPLVD